MDGPEQPLTPETSKIQVSNTFEDYKPLYRLEKELSKLEEQQNTFEDIVGVLDAAIRSHPESSYNSSQNPIYSESLDPNSIEVDIAVMIGLTSQKWSEIKESEVRVHKQLIDYEKDKLENPNSNYFQTLRHTYERSEKRLRSTEHLLEQISIETYRILEAQPSPETKVLHPSSTKPITGD